MSLRVVQLWVFAILIALEGLAPSHAGPLPAAPVTWLIFVDDLHIDFRDTGYLRNLLRSIATELIQDGDLFSVRFSGPSSLSVPLDSNRAVLDASIQKASGNGITRGDCLAAGARVAEMDDELRYRAQLAGTAAAELLNSLPKSAMGHVALLYISDGYARLPVAGSIADLPRTAERSAVTVFALKPHALRSTPQVVPSSASTRDPCGREEDMLKSLRDIAQPTGGFAVLETADFADALQRIARAMR